MRFAVFYRNIIFYSAPKLYRHRNGTVNDTVEQVKNFDFRARENIDKPLFRAVAVFRRPITLFEVIGHAERFSYVFEDIT